MAITLSSRDKGIKIWPGPYREADPGWKTQFKQWINQYLPEGTAVEIINILQRDDSRGFKIDLIVGRGLKIFLTLHFQGEDPYKKDRSLFLITSSMPFPIKEYYPIKGNIVTSEYGRPYEIYKNNQFIRDDDDPLIQSVKKALDGKTYRNMYNPFGKKSIRIKHSYTEQIGITNRYFTVEIKNHLRIFPSEEFERMVFECDSFLILKMKKNKKKKIMNGMTSFFGLYKFLLGNYNSILSQKVIIEQNYK